MSRTNQQRRQAKAKSRRRAASSRRQPSPDAPCTCEECRPRPPLRPTVAEQVGTLIGVALSSLMNDDEAGLGSAVRRLADGPTSGAEPWRRATERHLGDYLLGLVRDSWRHGWEPADVVRAVRRTRSAAHAELLRDAVAAELAGYARDTVPPRWLDQLTELEATCWWPRDQGWLSPGVRQPWAATVRLALELADTLARLPRLTRLGPVPGATTHRTAASRSDVDERVLAKVRALLAKAESTPYPAEAETFTAGAQAMMARHSIDRALLDATAPDRTAGPVGRRLGIDNPYEGPKAMLLNAVADANRCRVVWSKALGFCTVVGHDADLDAVELLFTSLLVQATTAVTRAGAKKDAAGRSRTRSFRQSFLISYARRIGERLSEATSEQTRDAAAEPGRADLLPVLAARRAAVDETTEQMFPDLVERRVGSADDREGWATGRAAADLADLRTATPLPSA